MRLAAFGRVNLPMLGTALMLCAMGLFALWTYEDVKPGTFDRQIVFVGVGLAVLGIALVPHYHATRHVAYPFYAICLGALVALLFFGKYTNGARGWFSLGPIKVQPAEFMKIALVLSLGRWLSFERNLGTWRGLAGPSAMALIPMGLVLAQPDFGNAMLFIPVLLAMLYVAGARGRHLAIVLAVLLVAAPVAFQFGLKDYQRNRLVSFVQPEKCRQASYQQTQSKRACASGRAFGTAFGDRGGAGFVVPERHTDFVFSIVAEELGFAGSSFLLILFAAFFALAGRIACATREPFGRLIVVGLTLFMALQVFVNVGMTLGMAPITGLTLPFVSYGGSSLVTCFLSTALILNVGSRWVPTWSRRDLDAAHVAIREFVPQGAKWLS